MEDNVLTKLVRSLPGEVRPVDYKEGLMGDMVFSSCFGHSDHEIVEYF